MKVDQLKLLIEKQKLELSEAKAKSKKFLLSNNKKFSKALSDNFDTSIDALSDMNVALHKRLKAKLKKESHNDDNSLFNKHIEVKDYTNPGTYVKNIVSTLNLVHDQVVKFAAKDENITYNNVINHRTMERFKMTPTYFKAQKECQECVEKIIKSLDKVSFEKK